MKKKGKNPFLAHQAGKVESRKDIIEKTLDYMSQARISVEYITDLAEYCAVAISKETGKPCNKATLLRNKEYKAKLLAFMSGQHGKGLQNFKGYQGDDEKVRLHITSLEAQVSNIKAEKQRLLYRVQQLEELSLNQELETPKNLILENQSNEINNLEIDLALTCKALQLVLDSMPGNIIRVSSNGHEIHDYGTSKRAERVVVDKNIASPFFKWLSKNNVPDF